MFGHTPYHRSPPSYIRELRLQFSTCKFAAVPVSFIVHLHPFCTPRLWGASVDPLSPSPTSPLRDEQIVLADRRENTCWLASWYPRCSGRQLHCGFSHGCLLSICHCPASVGWKQCLRLWLEAYHHCCLSLTRTRISLKYSVRNGTIVVKLKFWLESHCKSCTILVTIYFVWFR